MGGQGHAPAALFLEKRHFTHCTGDWVRPRAGLDGCAKSRPHWDSIPGPSNPQRVTIAYSHIILRLNNVCKLGLLTSGQEMRKLLNLYLWVYG
jgi:hypothetical protein